ncbi:MAG: ABC transporter ATP-binding protein/permease [Proteobacteria bacterium]|nr:ABC transporter ATP-binding protein/permease [Pseudomonadota bacterium]
MLSFSDLWQSVKQHKKALMIGQLLALVGALVAVPVPLLMPLLVDEVLLHKPATLTQIVAWLVPADWLGPVVIVLVVMLLTITLRLSSLLLGVATTRIFVSIAKTVTLGVRERLLDKLSRVSMQVYESLGSGQVTARLLTDVETLDKFLGETVAKVLVAVLSIVGVAGVLLWMHWQLALIILFLNPFVIGLTMILGKKVKNWKQRENGAFELLSQSVAETLDAMQQLRAANADKRFLARAKAAAEEVRLAAIASGWKTDALSRFSFGVFLAGFEVFRAVAMLTVLFSDLSIGEMIGVFGYLWFMMGPVQELLSVQYAYYGAKAALGRINSLLEAEEEPQYAQQAEQLTSNTALPIRLENVSFAYKDAPPVLDAVSLNIAAGEQVALVGVSGAGKSTLVQLLLGLYTPNSGQIYYGDTLVNRLGFEQIRAHVGVVLQQPMLFNDSLRANLTLGLPETDEALWQVLAVAQLTETVKAMPNGLDTVLGRNGVRLSGGQRQRLAIARMMLAKPQVVILDEATSMLDTHTEAKLHEAMRSFLRGRTLLVIAHRLSAVKEADRVLVFDGGKIIEQGSHAELVQLDGGVYQRLYGGQ